MTGPELAEVCQQSYISVTGCNIHSHKASFAACVTDMYLALVVDNSTIFCFFELQDTAMVEPS